MSGKSRECPQSAHAVGDCAMVSDTIAAIIVRARGTTPFSDHPQPWKSTAKPQATSRGRLARPVFVVRRSVPSDWVAARGRPGGGGHLCDARLRLRPNMM